MKSRILKHISEFYPYFPHTAMEAQVAYSPITIVQVAEQILNTRRITRKDQSLLMSVLSSSSLAEHEQKLVNRIYEALHKGFIRVAD